MVFESSNMNCIHSTWNERNNNIGIASTRWDADACMDMKMRRVTTTVMTIMMTMTMPNENTEQILKLI